jgi:iron complex transport system ATP-binding protein
MLEARDVHLSRGGRPVLAGVGLGLRPGELVALVGPNGAGKSSLFAVLAGEIRPDRGSVTLDGRPLADFPAAALAAERAALEQAPSLAAPFSVAELVRLGMAAVPRADIDEGEIAARAMAAAGIAGLAARPADRLSGGERARAHLARVLAQLWAGRAAGGGRLLLLDEPTASLDLAHQVALMAAIRAEALGGAAVLAVLHDLNLAAAFADRTVLLSGGRVAATGASAAVLNARLLSAVYGAPISVERTSGGSLRIVPALPRAAVFAASGE